MVRIKDDEVNIFLKVKQIQKTLGIPHNQVKGCHPNVCHFEKVAIQTTYVLFKFPLVLHTVLQNQEYFWTLKI